MDSMMARLLHRIHMMVGVATVTAPAQDGGPVMRQQIRLSPDGVVRDATAVLSLFGIGSSAPVGSRVLYLSLGGDRSKVVTIGTVSGGVRFRNLRAGETVVYNAGGMSVHLGMDGVVVTCGGKPVVFKGAPKARFEMPIESTGEITAMADDGFVTLSKHKGHVPNGQPAAPGA